MLKYSIAVNESITTRVKLCRTNSFFSICSSAVNETTTLVSSGLLRSRSPTSENGTARRASAMSVWGTGS
ncbi:MAG: hypothetical protein ABSB90_06300 [Thermoplasmata archaeon]